MAGFEYRGQLNGSENPVTLHCTIKNSATIKVGDMVYNDSAGITRAAAGATNPVLGVCVGIVNDDGIDLDNANPSSYDGAWTSSTQTYVAASDNMTDKKVKAIVIADPFAIWYNDADGDFTNPADEYLHCDLADHDQVDESETTEDDGQVFILKLDPDEDGDASKCLVTISAPQLFSFERETH